MTRIDNDFESLHNLIVKLNVLDNLALSVKKDRGRKLMKLRISLESESVFSDYKGYRFYKKPMEAIEDVTDAMAEGWVINVTQTHRIIKRLSLSQKRQLH